MDIGAQLARMERQKDRLIVVICQLSEIVGINNAVVAEVLALIKAPSSSELSDLLKQLVAGIAALQAQMGILVNAAQHEADGRG